MCIRCIVKFVFPTVEEGQKNFWKRHVSGISFRRYNVLVMFNLEAVYLLVCNICLNDVFW